MPGSPSARVHERETVSAHRTAAKGELVLLNSTPPDSTLAIRHGSPGPNRNTHALTLTAIASNASAIPPPAGSTAPISGSSATAHRVK
jgi:hypothetical protein